MAQWLDTVFYGFDYAVLSAIHAFALATGGIFDWFFTAVTHLADDALGMIALGLLLLLFKRTRKTGAAVLGGIILGALITNVTVKPLVFRARPYTHEAFRSWWEAMGAHVESDRSFPSGHTTAAMAAMMGIFLANRKKYSWTALLFALLMGFTRLYLVVHYPTDVLAGLIAGAIGGALAYVAVILIYRFLEKHRDRGFCKLVLEAAPVLCLVRRVRGKRHADAARAEEQVGEGAPASEKLEE